MFVILTRACLLGSNSIYLQIRVHLFRYRLATKPRILNRIYIKMKSRDRHVHCGTGKSYACGLTCKQLVDILQFFMSILINLTIKSNKNWYKDGRYSQGPTREIYLIPLSFTPTARNLLTLIS